MASRRWCQPAAAAAPTSDPIQNARRHSAIACNPAPRQRTAGSGVALPPPAVQGQRPWRQAASDLDTFSNVPLLSPGSARMRSSSARMIAARSGD